MTSNNKHKTEMEAAERAAQAQQLAADVAAQDGLDDEQAAAFEQCLMDLLEQEGQP